jgi:hypothetical protein
MLTPAEAIHCLRLELHYLGSSEPAMYEAHAYGVSVLSVAPEVTVWCYHGLLRWRVHGRSFLHSADDPGGAAYLITRWRLPHDVQREPHGGMSALPAATDVPGWDSHRSFPLNEDDR